MEFYIYQADVYCKPCADKIKAASTNRPLHPEDESSYDSDVYPKGPYENQESDTPDHCAGCRMFLENPLTQAGYDYLREKVAEYDNDSRGVPEVIQQWREFYPEAWE
jgi:hypothetical protein